MWGPRLWARGRTPKKRTFRCYISRIWGEKTPCRIYTKFCTTGDIRDVITPANFGIDRFRGLSVARGQILGFSIGFRSRPYNTLALPCECVIWTNLGVSYHYGTPLGQILGCPDTKTSLRSPPMLFLYHFFLTGLF